MSIHVHNSALKVAIVTSYHQEPIDVIRRNVDSVASQSGTCTHILVSDGNPRSEIDRWPVQHIRLPQPHADYGFTPMLIGSASAYSQGFDCLCWLDADNWYEPSHVASLLQLARQTRSAIVTATRNLRRPDGSLLGICTESDGDRFNDTNCYLLMREAMRLSIEWVFNKREHLLPMFDRVIWRIAKASFPCRAHHPIPTVNYTTLYAGHYLKRRELPPPGAKVIVRRDGIAEVRPYSTRLLPRPNEIKQ